MRCRFVVAFCCCSVVGWKNGKTHDMTVHSPKLRQNRGTGNGGPQWLALHACCQIQSVIHPSASFVRSPHIPSMKQHDLSFRKKCEQQHVHFSLNFLIKHCGKLRGSWSVCYCQPPFSFVICTSNPHLLWTVRGHKYSSYIVLDPCIPKTFFMAN